METDREHIIDLLRLLAHSLENPVLDRCPLSEIADLGDQAIPLLIDALTHDDPVIRRTAAHALGQLRSPVDNSLDLEAAVPHLERMLETDPDPLARLNAAEALWFITGSRKVVSAFLKGLSHEDVKVRRFAVTMLGLVEADLNDTMRPLTAALSDTDPFVRATAAEVLAIYGSAAAEALPSLKRLLGEDEYTRVVAVYSILCIDPSRTQGLVPVLTGALRNGDRMVRQRAAQVLGEIPSAAGALAIHSLIQALDDEEEGVRLVALNTLQNLGEAAAPAVPALIGVLATNDLLARGMAADALGAIGPAAEKAAPKLLQCLQEPGNDALATYFRLRAARALWRIQGEPEHLLAIGLESIRSPEWWRRGRGTAFLGELGAAGRAAIPDLSRLLKDEHRGVREAARLALEQIDPTA